MINLHSNSLMTKWFVWSCDHLPLTVTREYGEGKPSDGLRRNGAHYIECGTTLCHIVWAILWVPLLLTAFGSRCAFIFIMMHVKLYQDHSAQFGIAAAFIPEGFTLVAVLLAAVLVFSVIGAGKVGFFKLLWLYLKSIKSRVCPLVSFVSTDRNRRGRK